MHFIGKYYGTKTCQGVHTENVISSKNNFQKSILAKKFIRQAQTFRAILKVLPKLKKCIIQPSLHSTKECPC